MEFDYNGKNDIYTCTNGSIEVIGTNWDSSMNCNDQFINITLFCENVIHCFDINIFTTQILNMEIFNEYCEKFFRENKEFSKIYDYTHALTKTAFACFNVEKISVFCRRQKLLTKPTVIFYGEFKSLNDPFNLIPQRANAPLDYPGTRRDAF